MWSSSLKREEFSCLHFLTFCLKFQEKQKRSFCNLVTDWLRNWLSSNFPTNCLVIKRFHYFPACSSKVEPSEIRSRFSIWKIVKFRYFHQFHPEWALALNARLCVILNPHFHGQLTKFNANFADCFLFPFQRTFSNRRCYYTLYIVLDY